MNARVDPAELVRNFCQGIHSPGHEDRVGHYMYTHTGVFWPCDPRPDEIRIADIAAHLSRINRFGGGTITAFSVAEHCLLGSNIVPRHWALEFLLHDVAEAYIGDMIQPIKSIPAFYYVYRPVEELIERAAAERFQLHYPWPAEIKHVDEMMQNAEVAQNIKSKFHNIHTDEKLGAVGIQLQFYKPELAEILFMARFEELAKERGLSA